MTAVSTVKATKSLPEGARICFRAKVLRAWETGGLRMSLVGDESGLTRVETGDRLLEAGASYEFRQASVRQYPGGWTSVSIARGGEAVRLEEDVPAPQDEAYVERTYRILAGIQRKKGRRDGRLPAWQHPANKGGEP